MNTQGKRLVWGASIVAIIALGYILCRIGMYHAGSPAPTEQTDTATTTQAVPDVSVLESTTLYLPDSTNTLQLVQGKGRFVTEGTPFFTEVRLLEPKRVASHEGQQYFIAPFGVDSGGTGYFVYAGLFTASAPSAPQHLTSVFIGDRVIVQSITQADDGALEVAVLERPADAPMSAEPTQKKTYRYMISNSALVPLDALPANASDEQSDTQN